VSEIRVGVIGYGLAGRLFHAPFIACTSGLRLTHVVTRSPERAAQVASDHRGVTAVDSVAELLATEVDVVVVASPSSRHAEHAGAALAADRHVVLDKPAARTAEEFETLIATAQRRERQLIVFHNRRWDSEFRTLRQILDGGQLGTVHRFETRMERWRPLAKGGWRESTDPADMGGLRYDLGPHLVDQALQLFGPVTGVQARSQSLREVGSQDDDVLATLSHDSGVTTVVSASLLAAIPGPRFRALGTHGAAVLEHTDTQEDRLRAGERPVSDGIGWGSEPASTAHVVVGESGAARLVPYLDGQWPAFYRGVRDCLLGDGPPPVTAESALNTMRVVDAIGEAARTGQTIAMKGAHT
jgi:predicted dehydrogenase